MERKGRVRRKNRRRGEGGDGEDTVEEGEETGNKAGEERVRVDGTGKQKEEEEKHEGPREEIPL
jgi:hypothetical protein